MSGVIGASSLLVSTLANDQLKTPSAAAALSERAPAMDGASSIHIGSVASGSLKILGVAAIAYDVVTSSAKAEQPLQVGNESGAARILTDLAARLEFGLEGAKVTG